LLPVDTEAAVAAPSQTKRGSIQLSPSARERLLSQQKIEETKMALRELRLDDSVSTE
jgi:hypothetical protein